MIINEEQSRHHVENEVTNLEQRIAKIENDFETKYEADVAAVKTALERQINTTRTDFGWEMNTTKATLEHQSHALEKEKSNRRQLEREYTRLITEFHNLSQACDGLVAKYDSLNADMAKINSSSNLCTWTCQRTQLQLLLTPPVFQH